MLFKQANANINPILSHIKCNTGKIHWWIHSTLKTELITNTHYEQRCLYWPQLDSCGMYPSFNLCEPLFNIPENYMGSVCWETCWHIFLNQYIQRNWSWQQNCWFSFCRSVSLDLFSFSPIRALGYKNGVQWRWTVFIFSLHPMSTNATIQQSS